MGTAGAIKFAEKYLKDENQNQNSFFIVLNSDIVCEYPFKEMIYVH